MERDVVLPPPALVPSLPHCVATTKFAWDWPHSSSRIVSEVNRWVWCFPCCGNWPTTGQQYPINPTNSVWVFLWPWCLCLSLVHQSRWRTRFSLMVKAKLNCHVWCADVWSRTTAATRLHEASHSEDHAFTQKGRQSWKHFRGWELTPWCDYARKPPYSEVFYFIRQYTTLLFKPLSSFVVCATKTT